VRNFGLVGQVVGRRCVEDCNVRPVAFFKCTEYFQYEFVAGLLLVLVSTLKGTDKTCDHGESVCV
jgi:hypothetical protein